jgi:hypothetical protein
MKVWKKVWVVVGRLVVEELLEKRGNESGMAKYSWY